MLAAEARGLPMAAARSADAIDVMEILEAMADEEEKHHVSPPPSELFALPPSVLPFLGVSRGRLPVVAEVPTMLEVM